MPYESFALEPQRWLVELCRFLGVEAQESYLRDCAAIVQSSSARRRLSTTWKDTDLSRVDELIKKYDFLLRYTFEDTDECYRPNRQRSRCTTRQP